ncbi:choice-of-anchor D domain-containing protein [Kordia sp. YSTF-M3]|uniref:Choice-of-anchor D domain-containing protein n=1 Tax=Kordia aestuariivivens TaxID=2759037 RepID=A0ABR7Q9F8_9FLAO|nr:GEVED domain-containing protein [Kordia aestuariivivens]MBC8755195.1 choice-of-anchor D domain-containing protein [Kordia aestuariivivens]
MKKTYSLIALLLSVTYASAQYCVSVGNDPSGEYISRVQLASLVPTTLLDNASPSTPATGYTDFTGLTPTNLSQNTTYTVSVEKTWPPAFGGPYDEGVGVWIDYDQDGFFAPTELVFNDIPNQTTPVSGNFTVPLSAIPGNTRMRVQMQYNVTPNDPCDVLATGFDYGEVEDYTVNIVSSSLPPDIYVSGNTVEILDGSVNTPAVGDNTDFGTVETGTTGVLRTFVIENTGNTTDLILPTDPISFGVGTDAAFTVTTQPSDLELSSGETTTFQITYAPTLTGPVTGEIIIASNDPDVLEQSYTFNIAGNGILPIPAPANVSSSLQLWMKADVGTTVTGTDVDLWTDQSPNSFTATSQGTADAQLVTDGLNFNPILRFSGTQFLNLGDQPELDLQPLTDEMTIITMVVTNGASTGTVLCKGNNNVRNYQVWFGGTDRVLHHTLGRISGAASDQAVRWGTIYALNEPKLTSGVVADTGDPLTRLTPYMNGVLDPADRNDGVLSGAATVDVLIGARRSGSGNTGSGYPFSGDIAEIIIYDRDLTALELQKVESYLAIKYGITLGSNDAFWDTPSNTSSPFGYTGTSNDYLDSNGITIWDGTANAGYGYNVFGIARDDNSQLMQTQSKSVNISPADILTMRKEGGAFASNASYLLVGNNGLAETTQTTTLPERTLRMLNKVWLARESTTDVGTVELEFDMSASGVANLDDLELYIANGTSFAAYENYIGTNVGGVLTFTGVNLSDGQYFTLAEPETITGSSALFFDGIDDYVEDKTPTTLGLTDYTVMGWIKNPGQSVVNATRRMLGVQGQFRFSLDSGSLTIQEGLTGGAGAPGSGSIRDWVHFAIIVNSSTGRADYYINGRDFGGGGLDPLASNTNPFRMGTFDNVNFFEGSIDEVRIFNTAVTIDQLREMVHQEIEQNGVNVRGKIIPKDLEDFTSGANLPWSSLIAYYDMSSIKGNRIEDATGNGNTAFMKNITTIEPQTAPMPYISIADGNWTDDATWEFGSVWDTPSASSINWSIVQIRNNVTASASYSTLGLTVDAGASLTVTGTNPTINSTSPFSATSGVGYALTNTWYTELNGIIDLDGESQFLQTERSDLAVTSAGYIEKDQQGTANKYTYNYWSSPVSLINTTVNNLAYTLDDVFLDGTNPAIPSTTIDWNPHEDGETSPFRISTRWIYKYVNGADEDYDAWQFVRNTGSISPGEGYTMKGVSFLDEREDQNYVFRGKPNNGVITVSPLDDTNLYLVGNPYPSVLDANEFINDNIANDATSGTLFFWEHWGGGTHTLLDYQGGYATYTLSGGTPALSHPTVNQTGSGDKTPGQFVSVGQGFFVQGDSNAGNGVTATVEFNNSQRNFTREYVSTFTVFVRDGIDAHNPGMFENPENATEDSQEENTIQYPESTTTSENDANAWYQEFGIRTDYRKKIRLGYTTSAGFHRQILLTFDRNATDGVDLGYEGESIDGILNDMYWSLQGEKYVIQAVDNLYQQREVPIGLIAENAGGGTIMLDELENIDASVNIYIKDNYTGATHDLRASDFQVAIPAGETNDKYSLVFQRENPLSINNEILENGITMYTDTETDEIVITNNTNFKLEGIDMHTILGQRILSIKEGINENTIRIPINDKASGIYVISIYSEKGKISKKLVVQ